MSAYDIYKSIERLSEILKVGSRKIGAEYGLQPVQLEVLHYLYSCNRFSDTTLSVADYLGQTKGTVSQTIKVLEKKGFLKKVADASDKRVIHLEVTDSGAAIIRDNLPSTLFYQVCDTLPEAQQQDICQSMAGLMNALVRDENVKSFGVCKTCKHHRSGESGYFCDLLKVPLYHTDVDKICKEHEGSSSK